MAVVLLASCAKELDKPLKTVNVSKSNGCLPGYTTNPFDTVGKMHNEHLDAVHRVYPVNRQQNVNRTIEVSDSIMVEEYGSSILSVCMDSIDVANILTEAERDMMVTHVQGLGLNLVSEAFLIDIYGLLDDYDGTNACTIIADIRTKEADLIANNNLVDITIALKTSSVARHSLHYWHSNNFFGMENPKAWNWRKIFIVVCDVAGATSGALAGSATVVGGIAGGIAGGVGASAAGAGLWDAW